METPFLNTPLHVTIREISAWSVEELFELKMQHVVYVLGLYAIPYEAAHCPSPAVQASPQTSPGHQLRFELRDEPAVKRTVTLCFNFYGECMDYDVAGKA